MRHHDNILIVLGRNFFETLNGTIIKIRITFTTGTTNIDKILHPHFENIRLDVIPTFQFPITKMEFHQTAILNNRTFCQNLSKLHAAA